MNIEQARYRISLLPDAHARRCATHLCPQVQAAERRTSLGKEPHHRPVVDDVRYRSLIPCLSPYAPSVIYTSVDNHLQDNERAWGIPVQCKCGAIMRRMSFGRECTRCKRVLRYRRDIHCAVCGKQLTAKQAFARRYQVTSLRARMRRPPDWWPTGPHCSRECQKMNRQRDAWRARRYTPRPYNITCYQDL